MKYKIVVDSCCDLTDEMRGWNNLEVVPLTLEVGDYHIFDDADFDQDDFISRVKAYDGVAKSACPAPDAFKKAYEGDCEEVYVLTITDKLSGTYNSALQGKALYEEEHNDGKKIYVFNSLSTSGTETLVAQEIRRVCELGMPFEEVKSYINDYIVNHNSLYFCLESLDALKNNGRLFALAASVLEKIKIKLVCKRTDEGNITLSGQDFTINRALIKLVNFIANDTKDKNLKNKTLIISYVCCKDRADFVAQKVREKTGFANVITLKASGLNSLYAADGGIIVSYNY